MGFIRLTLTPTEDSSRISRNKHTGQFMYVNQCPFGNWSDAIWKNYALNIDSDLDLDDDTKNLIKDGVSKSICIKFDDKAHMVIDDFNTRFCTNVKLDDDFKSLFNDFVKTNKQLFSDEALSNMNK